MFVRRKVTDFFSHLFLEYPASHIHTAEFSGKTKPYLGGVCVLWGGGTLVLFLRG